MILFTMIGASVDSPRLALWSMILEYWPRASNFV